jgi:glycine/D-amino acid oxidase-like deaminating enzyme
LQRASEVLIAGAGVMGAALAYWLTRLDPALRVVLVEPDTGFSLASSSRSASSIRQQFSCPVNVRLSQFGFHFLREAHAHLAIDGDMPQLSLREAGYLYLAREQQADSLRTLDREQVPLGVRTALLDAAALRHHFPWLRCHDLALGRLGLEGEGWFDGPALHRALLAKARRQGAQLVRDRVVHAHDPAKIVLASGSVWRCEHFVCAAGGWSGALAQASGLRLEVYPSRRTVFVLSCPTALPAMPLVIDPSGFWIRPEGRHFLLGFPPRATEPGAIETAVKPTDTTIEPAAAVMEPAGTVVGSAGSAVESTWTAVEPAGDASCHRVTREAAPPPWAAASGHTLEAPEPQWQEFDEASWARLADRIPAFAAIRIEGAWAGYYDMHLLDHNAVIGAHPERPYFHFLCGFSGHGMQHAPGAALALAEQILHGESRSLQVSVLGYQRVLRGEPYRERNVIG